ncbi:hypothetical protein AB0K49_11200 [Streptomyces decoyicus]
MLNGDVIEGEGEGEGDGDGEGEQWRWSDSPVAETLIVIAMPWLTRLLRR